MLVGCAADTEHNETLKEDVDTEENTAIRSIEEPNTEQSLVDNETLKEDADTEENTAIRNIEEPNIVAAPNLSSEQSTANDLTGTHSEKEYTREQIEYARVWRQLGPNQAIEELNVLHIPAGTPLHAEDDTSVSYPEAVIQLSGSRLVDGSVTYSGNGDGTINVYNVPLRWDGQYPAGKKFYTEIIENTKQVYIHPEKVENIVELIKLQK